MKKLFFVFAALMMFACVENTSVVDSGTYTGEIVEVEADKDEIYVELEDGKTIELYFTPDTQLMNKEDKAVKFDQLDEGQKVEVTVTKIGQRLDPEVVKIME
jgi:hypothetical protein